MTGCNVVGSVLKFAQPGLVVSVNADLGAHSLAVGRSGGIRRGAVIVCVV